MTADDAGSDVTAHLSLIMTKPRADWSVQHSPHQEEPGLNRPDLRDHLTNGVQQQQQQQQHYSSYNNGNTSQLVNNSNNRRRYQEAETSNHNETYPNYSNHYQHEPSVFSHSFEREESQSVGQQQQQKQQQQQQH